MIRQEMAREADFDVDLFAEIVRTGTGPTDPKTHSINEINPDESFDLRNAAMSDNVRSSARED